MKRKKREEEHIDEGWLLPYADMLTLVLALFIVMFAMASVDDAKFQEFRTEFGTIFAGLQTGGDSLVGPIVDLGSFSGEGGNGAADSVEVSTKAVEEAKEDQLAQKMEDQQMVTASEKLKADLEKSDFGKEMNVSLKSDGLHINLDSNILFAPGSANLGSDVAKSLGVVAPHLKDLNQEIIVAGYTDNVPENVTYASNWELSAARAISVMNYLVEEKIVRDNQISIQAYGENKPHATNQTAQGRAKNRRVEIIIKKVYQ
ncbi:OmpA family protein [Enterococcus sp. LJL98]